MIYVHPPSAASVNHAVIKKTVYKPRCVASGSGGMGQCLAIPVGGQPPSDVVNFVGSLFEEADPATGATTNTKYVFLGDQRFASISNGNVLYFHGDHLGSTNVVTDATGVAKEIIEYEPYGQESRHDKLGTPEEVANYYFTAQYKDDESGLYFYNARYYMPLIGRFISADSIVPSPNNPQSLNRYSYVYNNPVNLVDPSGHFAWLAPLLIAALKGALIGALVGGIVSVATGGSFGAGALSGAIGGAIGGITFGAAGDIIGKFSLEGAGKAIAHVMAGGVASGLASVAEGGDFGRAALIGGISAGVAKFAGDRIPGLKTPKAENFAQFSANSVRRAVVAAVIGGGVAEASDGRFLDGARSGAISGALGYALNDESHNDGYLEKMWRTFTRGMNNIVGKILENDFGKTTSRIYKRSASAIRTTSDVWKTLHDSNLSRGEKVTISALQVAGSGATLIAGTHGAIHGALLGAPFGGSAIGAVALGTIYGAATAEAVRQFAIDPLKTHFYNN